MASTAKTLELHSARNTATLVAKTTIMKDIKDKVDLPKSLNIIIGTGVSYTRLDGINVISLASLGV